MLKLAADENFNNDIVAAVRQRRPDLDLVTVQEAGLRAAPDEDVLEWAASEGRVLLTHDVTTMTRHTYDRIRAGQKMPGVLEVSTSAPYSVLIEDILILVDCSIEGEWEWQVRYLPFTASR
jgi:hypothetical protein